MTPSFALGGRVPQNLCAITLGGIFGTLKLMGTFETHRNQAMEPLGDRDSASAILQSKNNP